VLEHPLGEPILLDTELEEMNLEIATTSL